MDSPEVADPKLAMQTMKLTCNPQPVLQLQRQYLQTLLHGCNAGRVIWRSPLGAQVPIGERAAL